MTTGSHRDRRFAGDDQAACGYHSRRMLASLGILRGVGSLLGVRLVTGG